MIADLLQLAATDTNSTAYKVGEVIGTIIGILLMIGIPILFIVCLVKFITTKNKGWLIGLVLTCIPLVLLVGAIAVGVFMGYKNAKTNSLSGFSSKNTTTLVVPNSKLTLDVPSNWKNIDDLNDVADLEMGNLFQEQYLIVISEPKSDFDGNLTDYSDLTTKAMIDSIENSTTSAPVSLTVNGMPAIQHEFSGSVARTKIAYLHTSIEGGEHLYQIISWTTPSRKSTSFKVFQDVVNSAKE